MILPVSYINLGKNRDDQLIDESSIVDGQERLPSEVSLSDEKMANLQERYITKARLLLDSPLALDKYINNCKDIFKNSVSQNRTKDSQVQIIRRFNFPLDPANTEEQTRQAIFSYYQSQVEPATRYRNKFDCRVGGLLEHFDDDGQAQSASYFYPCRNSSIIPDDKFVDVGRVGEGTEGMSFVHSVDIEAAMIRDRKDTKTKMLFVTNVEFAVFQCGSALVGASDETLISTPVPAVPGDPFAPSSLSIPIIPPLPRAMKQSRCLLQDPYTNKDDCLWRCLVVSMGKSRCLKWSQREAVVLCKKFVSWRKVNLNKRRPGVSKLLKGGLDIFSKENFQDARKHKSFVCDVSSILAQIENCHHINLYIYAFDHSSLKDLEAKYLSKTGKKPSPRQIREQACLNPIYVSCGKHGKRKCHLLLDGRNNGKLHCHLIKKSKVDLLACNFRCHYCNRFFPRESKCKAHMRCGTCLSRFSYKGGPFQRQKFLSERLTEEGIFWPIGLSDFTRSRLTWDIEAKVVPCTEVPSTAKVNVEGKHVAVSIAVCNNIPGYAGTDFFFEREDSEKLLASAYARMVELQEVAEQQWHQQMSPVYAILEQRIIEAGGFVKVQEDRFRSFPPAIQKKLQFLAKKDSSPETIADNTKLPQCKAGYRELPEGKRQRAQLSTLDAGCQEGKDYMSRGSFLTSEQEIDAMSKDINHILIEKASTPAERNESHIAAAIAQNEHERTIATINKEVAENTRRYLRQLKDRGEEFDEDELLRLEEELKEQGEDEEGEVEGEEEEGEKGNEGSQ